MFNYTNKISRSVLGYEQKELDRLDLVDESVESNRQPAEYLLQISSGLTVSASDRTSKWLRASCK